jgi:elongation factor P--(R)-beta-lysine ligase
MKARSGDLLWWTYRARVRERVRSWFSKQDYLELETPTLVISPGTEVHLGYFETRWTDFDGTHRPVWLRSSPELHLKQALGAGAKRVWNLGPCYRNGGELSEWHHPEFTMLEWYCRGGSLKNFIDDTEELLRVAEDAARKFSKDTPKLSEFSLTPLPKKFIRMGVYEAFEEFARIDLIDLDQDLAAKAREKGVISVQKQDSFETAFFKILIEKIEPALVRLGGCVLQDWPPSQAALAKVEKGRAKRFEFYVGRVELCNGFAELLGEQENRARIAEAEDARAAAGHAPVPADEDFLKAMSRGIPATCGNALGFDRLLALMAGQRSINRVLPFRVREPWKISAAR